MPFFVLIVLFVGVPILEISLLLKVGAAIGGVKTILFVIFTAILGAYLVKQQGIATLTRFQQEANAGRLPAQQILEGIALLFAGAVLMTPGFFTDALGFALLVPAVRQFVIAHALKNGQIMASGFARSGQHHPQKPDEKSTVIEGEYTDSPDDRK